MSSGEAGYTAAMSFPHLLVAGYRIHTDYGDGSNAPNPMRSGADTPMGGQSFSQLHSGVSPGATGDTLLLTMRGPAQTVC